MNIMRLATQAIKYLSHRTDRLLTIVLMLALMAAPGLLHAQREEIRILVAVFDGTDAFTSNNPQVMWQRILSDAIAGADWRSAVTVVPLPEVVSDIEQAVAVRAAQSPNLLIWGAQHGDATESYFLTSGPDIGKNPRQFPPVSGDLAAARDYLVLYVRGFLLSWDAQPEQALAALEDAATLLPDDPDEQRDLGAGGLFYNIGYVQDFYFDDQEAAIEFYSAGVDIDATGVIAARTYHNRGRMNYLLARYALALEDYNVALRLNPDYANALNNRGLAKMELADLRGALADFEQVVVLDPSYGIAYANIGDIYRDLGDYHQAESYYNQALHIDPNSTSALYDRAWVRSSLDNYRGAVEDLTRMIALGEATLEAYYSRGTNYIMLDEYELAYRDLTEALRLEPQPRIYLNRGVALRLMLYYEDAIVDFNEALRLSPNFGLAYYNRGLAYNWISEFDQAIADFDRAIELMPYYRDAVFWRAETYKLMQRWEDAIRDYETYIDMGGDEDGEYYDPGAVAGIVAHLRELVAERAPHSEYR